MSEQLDLQLGRQSGPVATPEEIEQVCQFLAGRDWTTAREIEQAINIDERRIRAIAEASDGLILSGPGCPGYKLFTDAAQLREVDEAASRLESQGRRMISRAMAYRRRAHRLIA